MCAFLTDLAVVCASRCHIQASLFNVRPSDLNMSRNEILGYKEYWESYPDLNPIPILVGGLMAPNLSKMFAGDLDISMKLSIQLLLI
jgi:hypothetical protein